MSNRNAFLFLLIILFSNGYSQTNYFNKRYELTSFSAWDFSTTVIEIPDGYVVLGETGGEYNWRTNSLIKIDLLGNIEWIKTIGDTISEWSIGYPGSLIKAVGPFYYSAGLHRSYTSDWVHDRGLLIKYNADFDTLWSREYGEISEPYDTAYIFRNLKQTSDGGVIITGVRYPHDAMNASAYMIKTDSSGNKQWDKTFTNLSGDTQGFSVIQTSDGGFAIGAFQYYHVPPPNETGDPIVIKTDSLGNLQWVRNLGGDLMDTQAMVSNSNDGSILVLSAFSYLILNEDDCAKRIHITKITNNNTILIDRFYNNTPYLLYPENISCNQDGTIIAAGTAGTNFTEYPHMAGWIFKLNTNGDSLWFREYNLVSQNMSSNVFYDAIQTSDNGYLGCGYVNPVYPDTGTQDVWLVKVDSMGCESPSFCWVNSPEPIIALPAGQLQVWPNPAKEMFTITGFKATSNHCILEIYDLYGRKALEQQIAQGNEIVLIDCAGWPPGLYTARISLNGKIIGPVKIILQ